MFQRIISTALVTGAIILFTSPVASADSYVKQIADQLKSNPVYVDLGAGDVINQDQIRFLKQKMKQQDSHILFAVLPKLAISGERSLYSGHYWPQWKITLEKIRNNIDGEKPDLIAIWADRTLYVDNWLGTPDIYGGPRLVKGVAFYGKDIYLGSDNEQNAFTSARGLLSYERYRLRKMSRDDQSSQNPGDDSIFPPDRQHHHMPSGSDGRIPYLTKKEIYGIGIGIAGLIALLILYAALRSRKDDEDAMTTARWGAEDLGMSTEFDPTTLEPIHVEADESG